jgi:hypothetical protein
MQWMQHDVGGGAMGRTGSASCIFPERKYILRVYTGVGSSALVARLGRRASKLCTIIRVRRATGGPGPGVPTKNRHGKPGMRTSNGELYPRTLGRSWADN